jgi:hypothetical protein
MVVRKQIHMAIIQASAIFVSFDPAFVTAVCTINPKQRYVSTFATEL